MDVVAVDWSGARAGARRRIWWARVHGGELVDLHNGRSREEVVADLVALRKACPDGLAVGLDFAFSLPAWFAHQCAATNVTDVWQAVARDGESWLAGCHPPFWGRPGRRRPEVPEPLRRTERAALVGGVGAKSVFQVGGAGAVGTGSLRGIPLLPVLRQVGFAIWPFDPPTPWVVAEIYPRLLTGPMVKSRPAERAAYLEAAPSALTPECAAAMRASEDAFDAGISALVMARHGDELAALTPSDDPVTLLEGAIWRPAGAPTTATAA